MKVLTAIIMTILLTIGVGVAVGANSNSTLENVFASPCPFDLSSPDLSCSFINVPADSAITIYDMAGRTVRELSGLIWDGRNKAGVLVASGTYIYRVESPDGSTFTGKLAVVK